MKIPRRKKFLKRLSKGDVSYLILFAIAAFSILLAGGGSTLSSQYSAFGGLILHTLSGGNNTVQLHTMQFITYTPTPTLAPTVNPDISPTQPPTVTSSVTTTATPTSPPASGASMLCGTNLGLFDSHDTFLANTATRGLTASLHVGTIRIPWQTQGNQPITYTVQAAQYAQQMGLVPLITLHLTAANAFNDDKSLITAMNGIFNNTLVYYELGNEPDLHGYNNVATYIAAWNTFIPQLKQMALNGKFGGPANFQKNPSYIASFLQGANPAPDFVSWHEYTCNPYGSNPLDPAAYCYDHVATTPGHNWGQHMIDTKAAVNALGKTLPPVFITEWGPYSAGTSNGADSRIAQLVAMHFDQAALNELKNIGVFAAYQYVLNTNIDYNLIDNSGNALTGYGQDFQNTCAGF